MDKIDAKAKVLTDILSTMRAVLVAYSGGVDSTYLLWAALDALGQDRVLAVTADAPIFPRALQKQAAWVAHDLGVRHRFEPVAVLEDMDFVRNPSRRCYFCKRVILSKMRTVAQAEGLAWIVEGSNLDDQDEYRPGVQAVQELEIRSPLQEARLTKAEIRQLSRRAGLPTWNQAAQTCLATRFPHGRPITMDGLAQVEAAEEALQACLAEMVAEGKTGDVRVRHHGEIARIEVSPALIPLLVQPDLAGQLVDRLQRTGYRYVTLDLAGYRRFTPISLPHKRKREKGAG